MYIYELEEFLGGFTDEEKVGIMENHHIVFKSQGGCDFFYNMIELPTGLHKGNRGPHMCRNTDVFLKQSVQNALSAELGTKRKTADEIVDLCCPMNRKSKQKLYKRLESAESHDGKYEIEDAVRAIMSGKLY